MICRIYALSGDMPFIVILIKYTVQTQTVYNKTGPRLRYSVECTMSKEFVVGTKVNYEYDGDPDECESNYRKQVDIGDTSNN